jgi:DNA-binding NarL/FixJ family response regulator
MSETSAHPGAGMSEPPAILPVPGRGRAGHRDAATDPAAAIRKLAGGGRFIDPKLIDVMVFDTHSGEAAPHEILSDREFQVLHLLAAGKNINAIAEVLVLSAKTISTHKIRLMQKLALGNNADLIRYVIKHGLTSGRERP